MKNINSKAIFFLAIAIVLFAVSRLGTLFQELPPFMFCDEGIYLNEAYQMLLQNRWIANEFRAGSLNIYPVLILGHAYNFVMGEMPPYTGLLLFGRFLYLIIILPISLFFLYQSILLLFQNKCVAWLACISLIISPYVYSVSRFWYPDHYIIFFSCLALYGFSYYLKSSGSYLNSAVAGILIAVVSSVKYTGFFLVPFFAAFVILKNFNKYRISRDAIRNIFVDGGIAALAFFAGFLLINFSIILNFEKFLNDFLFNINNYDRSKGFNWSGIFYYYMVSHYLFLGLAGFITIVVGWFALFKRQAGLALTLSLPCLLFVAYLGSAGMVLNRNMSLVTPFIAIIFAYGAFQLISIVKIGRWGRVAEILVVFVIFALPVAQVSASIWKDIFFKDSRLLARAWIKANVPIGSTISHNDFCSGESPAQVKGLSLKNDPMLRRGSDYYVYNAYWNGLFSQRYSLGYGELPDQKYIHFYAFNQTSFRNNYSHTAHDLLDLIPEGYELIKKFTSNGPDILILKRKF